MSELEKSGRGSARPAPQRAPDDVAKIPYQRSARDIIAALGSDARSGLREPEARERLARYGKNELQAERATPAWKRFAAQLGDVLVILLLVAAAISGGLW